jgi:putative membrane protein
MRTPKYSVTLALLAGLVPLGMAQNTQTAPVQPRSEDRPAAQGETQTPATGRGKGNQSRRHAATESASAAADAHSKLAPADMSFMKKAAHSGMVEVELAKMAQEKASSGEVKEYARKLESDHSKANEELKTIARDASVTLPSSAARKYRRSEKRLAKLSGPEFDREYIGHMVRDHRMAVAEFKRHANSGQDQDLRQFASKAIPTLEEHLKLAEQIQASIGGAAWESRSSASKLR